MSRKSRPDRQGFCCIHCRRQIDAGAFGTRHRNHCPHCLWSRHLDDEVGDRRSACAQPMRPIGLESREDGEWAVIHRCIGCGVLRTNRVAGDDHELALLALALRPLARPPFPIEDLARLWLRPPM